MDGQLVFEVDKEALEAYTEGGQKVGPRLVSREASYINLFLDARDLPEDVEEFPGEVYADVEYVRVY